jgi:hypothetical protein
MRKWTEEDRKRQSERIRAWKPWEKSTGPRTPEGKAKCRHNAARHGLYSQTGKGIRQALRDHRAFLQALRTYRKTGIFTPHRHPGEGRDPYTGAIPSKGSEKPALSPPSQQPFVGSATTPWVPAFAGMTPVKMRQCYKNMNNINPLHNLQAQTPLRYTIYDKAMKGRRVLRRKPGLDTGYLMSRIVSGAKGGAAAIHAAFGGPDKYWQTYYAIKNVDDYSSGNTARLAQDFAQAETSCKSLKDHFDRFLSGWSQTHRQSLPAIAFDLMKGLGVTEQQVLTGQGLSADEHALARAMVLVAARAEMIRGEPLSPAMSKQENPFHNTLHTASLPLVSMQFIREYDKLARTGQVPAFTLADKMEILLSGFGHDIDHDGRPNPADQPFFNEKRSCERILPILYACGVSDKHRSSIVATILATSPNGGLQFLKKISHAIADGKELRIEELDPEGKNRMLHGLLDHPVNAFKAAIVEDADLYASTAAGDKAWKIMSQRLTEEQKSVGLDVDFTTQKSRMGFLDFIVSRFGFSSPSARKLCNRDIEACRAQTEERIKVEAQPAP